MGGTAVANYVVGSTTLSLKWKEQYASQALNKYMRAVYGRGIVRGFLPVAGVGDRQLTLGIDPLTEDSVIMGAGESASDNEAPAYREIAPVVLSLSPYIALSAERYLAFILNYTPSVATTAEYRLYTEAEYTGGVIDADGGVVIAKITAPGAPGPITDIDTSMRDSLWKWQHYGTPPGQEEVTLCNLVPGDAASAFLLKGITALSNLAMQDSNLYPALGTHTLAWVTSANGTHQAPLIGAATVRAGEVITLRCRYAFDDPTASVVQVQLQFFDPDGVTPIGTTNVVLPFVSGSAEYLQTRVVVPAGNVGLVRAQLDLTLNHPQTFLLNQLLITATRASNVRAGAPDTEARELIRGAVGAEALLTFAAGDSSVPPGVVSGDAQNMLIGAHPDTPVGGVSIGAIGGGSQYCDIFVKGAVALGYTGSVSGDDTVKYVFSDNTAAGSDRRVLWQHNQFVSGVTSALTNKEGAMELVSGAVWNPNTVQWNPDFSATDVYRLSVNHDGLRLYTIDRSQFPGTETDANAQAPLYIPVLKRLSTEDPEGKATPKLQFDVADGTSRLNLIEQDRLGASGCAYRSYTAGTSTRAALYETINARWQHASADFARDNISQRSAVRVIAPEGHFFRVTSPTQEASPFSEQTATFLNVPYYQLALTIGTGSEPQVQIRKGPSASATVGAVVDGIAQDLRVDFGTAAANTVATSQAASTNPASTVPITASLRAKSVLKAFLRIELPLAANPGAGVIFDGLNVASANANVGNTSMTVTYAAGLTVKGCVVPAYEYDGAINASPRITNNTAGGFNVELFNPATGAAIDLTTFGANGAINVHVYGIQ